MLKGLVNDMKACKEQPPDVFKVLKKIQAGVFRVGFNLWDIFRAMDTERKYVVTEPKFLSVINGPIRKYVGLTEEEVILVTNFFLKHDGNVGYEQFCNLVHDYRPSPSTKEDIEREDPYSANQNLTKTEEKLLYDTLTHIAVTVTKKKLLLRPFFQDYELIKKNMGLITKTTFFKVLSFMGVTLNQDLLNILVKRYMLDNYTVKYNAFLKELDDVFQYLERNDYTDNNGRLIRADDKPIYENPAPEGPQYGLKQVYSPCWKEKSLIDPKEVINIILKIRQHIYRNKIRVRDFFQVYDNKCSFRIDECDFLTAIRWLSYGRVDTVNLYLTKREIEILLDLYADPINHDRKLWKIFENDIEQDLNPKELQEWKPTPLEIPSQELQDRYPIRKIPSEEVKQKTINDILFEFKLRKDKFKIDFEHIFNYLDKNCTGYLHAKHFIEALTSIPIYLTDHEYEAICEKYMNAKSEINWLKLVDDINKISIKSTKDKLSIEDKSLTSSKHHELLANDKEIAKRECNIVEILAKIKSLLICYHAKISDYLSPYDENNSGIVSVDQFLKALSTHDLNLSETEIYTILDVFCHPENNNLVEYKKFIRTVDEKSVRPCIERPPLKDAMKTAAEARAKDPPDFQFLNFNERLMVSVAMKKLSSGMTLGDLDYFKSLDKENKGIINRYVFMNALYHLNVLHYISMKEVDVIIKCFGIIKDNDELDINYIDFLSALDIIFKTQKAAESV